MDIAANPKGRNYSSFTNDAVEEGRFYKKILHKFLKAIKAAL